MLQRHLLVVVAMVVIVVFVGCSSRKDRPGSMALLRASEHGLEVEQTVDDQAREAVSASPTNFFMSLDEDRLAWERARFFLERYVIPKGSGTPVVSKVVGSRWGLTNGDGGEYLYEVSKVSVPQGFRYTVKCAPRTGRTNQSSALNAANLARFIREGKLEVSLLPKA